MILKSCAFKSHFAHLRARGKSSERARAESRNKAGKKGRGGRETTPTAALTAAQTPALPLPTRPIEPSL